MTSLDRIEAWHKAEYDKVRVAYPEHNMPEWDALTFEQKEKMRKANDVNRQWFAELSEAIRTGGPLPNPLRGDE